MSDQKISQLLPVSAPQSGDVIPAARPLGGGVYGQSALDPQDIANLAPPSDFQPPLVTGRKYSGPMGLGQTIYQAAGNVLFCFPFWASRAFTATAIGVSIPSTAGSGKHVRLGIYNADAPDNGPSSLLLDAGAVAISGTGDISASISQDIAANTLYYLAVICDNSGVNDALFAADSRNNYFYFTASQFFGVDTIDVVSGYFTMPFNNADQAYGALPATYPGTPSVVDNLYVPYLWLKK